MYIRKDHNVQQADKISMPFFVLMLAVAFSNFLGLGSYILLALCAGFFIWNYYWIRIPGSVWPIVIFACLFFMSQIFYGDIKSMFKIFLCPLLWIMGYNLEKNPKIHVILRIAAILAMGMVIHGIANYYYNTVQGVSMAGATKKDVWSGEGFAATGQAVLFTPFLSLFIWLVFAQRKRWIKISVMILFCICAMYAIQLGSRTFLLLTMLSVALGILFYAQKRGKSGKILLAVLAFVGIFVILYSADISGLRTYIEESYLFHRMDREEGFYDLLGNGRFYFKRQYLKYAIQYPWGGSHLRKEIVGSAAHDLWLDIMDEAGIFTALAIFFYTIAVLYRILLCSWKKNLLQDERIALRSYGIIMYVQFFLEPIWQGSPMLLLFFVLVDGMLTRYARV